MQYMKQDLKKLKTELQYTQLKTNFQKKNLKRTVFFLIRLLNLIFITNS